MLPNPVGYNRVYVHQPESFDYESWWQGLRAGRSFVTNGPLLICQADRHQPGHVFRADQNNAVTIPIQATITSNQPIALLKLIQDGRIVKTMPVANADESQTIEFGTVTFGQSGWFLLRAITDNRRTFQFASTAPYYVEIGPTTRRISRSSAQFFLDWVDERMKRIRLTDAEQRNEVLKYHQQARKFWEHRVESANAD